MRNGILLLIVLCGSFASVYGQTDCVGRPSLRIEAISTKVDETLENHSIGVQLHLTFTNDTSCKILLLDRYTSYWGKDIYREETNGQLTSLDSQPGGNSYIHRDKQRKELLSMNLPSNEVRELEPMKSFSFDETIYIQIYKKKTYVGGHEILIEDVKKLSSVWLKLRYIFWDPNLDLELKTKKDLNFGVQLQKKWSSYGLLWTEPIESPPIEIPLPKEITQTAIR